MKSYKKKFISYIQNKPFGNYYIPARFQYLILRDYFNKINKLFSLPQGEPVFSKTSIRLRTIVNNLNNLDNLILLSMHVLPEDRVLREEMINKLIKKKIKTHCIFENMIANSKVSYMDLLKNYKLNKLISKSK
jgi:sporadic carbohydrate cluster protein (TIGR04323 family)